MRSLAAGSLALSLGLWAAGADAQERPSSPTTLHPLPMAQPAPLGSGEVPVATLGRPVALAASPSSQPKQQPVKDQKLLQACYTLPLLGPPRPLVRAQNADAPQLLQADVEANSEPPAPAEEPNTPEATPEPFGRPRLVPVAIGSGDRQTPAGEGDCAGSTAVCEPGDARVCCESGPCPACCTTCCKCASCGNGPYRFWASGEYLLWWMKDTPLPALVTTGLPGTPREFAGVLGAPGTAVLFGSEAVPGGERSGGRFIAGFWLDSDRLIGLEGGFFFLGERSIHFGASSAGLPILARPFIDVGTGREASEFVAFPGMLAGSLAVSSSSSLWGAELNLRTEWWRDCRWHIDLLTGFRYLALDESLVLTEGLIIPAGAGATAGSGIMVEDRFGTHNNFYGGQLGTEVGFRRGPWSLDLLAKVALGSNHEVVNINGNTSFFTRGMPVSVQRGGLYALPTNIGHFGRDRFAVVPEAGVKLGYQLTPRLRATVGYSFLYCSDVVRPGQQIDRVLNVSQLPSQIGPGTLAGPARPAPLLRSTDFWAQGMNFGLEIRY